MAQTSLGEIIRPSNTKGTALDQEQAYAAINSKRVDFAFFDRFGRAILVVEYQGSGHYASTSFIRDAVKREALRKAGVAMIEVPETPDHGLLRAQIMAHLRPQPSSAPSQSI